MATLDFCDLRRRGNNPHSGDVGMGDDSFNESLSVEVTDHNMFLKPLGMGVHRSGDAHLNFEGAAEYNWGRLIEPLQ